MAREYAPRNRRPAPKKGGVPGWIWMLAGLSLGLAVAAFVYISRPTQTPLRGTTAASEDGFEPEKRDPKTVSKETRPQRSRPVKAEAAQTGDKVAIPPKEKSRFTFYELLPSQEVLVPSQAPAKPTPQAALPANPATATTPATATAPAATASTPAAPAQTFIIQVASFKAQAEAEKQKANLALLGIEARVEKVTIDNRDTYYRVRVGPLRDERRARDTVAQLESNGFNAMMVRVK